jgi:hypothetical protein
MEDAIDQIMRMLEGLRTQREKDFQKRLKLERTVNSQQAKIDRLMLEYCPDEMTDEQLVEWAKHQKPV